MQRLAEEKVRHESFVFYHVFFFVTPCPQKKNALQQCNAELMQIVNHVVEQEYKKPPVQETRL